jgi:hypothetical protein
MTDLKLPKYRIIDNARDFATGLTQATSEKEETLMKAVAADEAYWLWVNETLFDRFTWASEAMAAKLNRSEIRSLRRRLEPGELYRVRFDDSKAYSAIIAEALVSDILAMKKALVSCLKMLEENTACVLKFTADGPIASAYPHGIPFVCYFTSEGPTFVVYLEKAGGHRVYKSSEAIPLSSEHIVKRVAHSVESCKAAFDDAQKLKLRIGIAEERLDNLKKFGKTTLR